MHIIPHKALKTFWEQYPDSQSALQRWHKIVRQTTFETFTDLRKTFPSADKVGDLVVFNIGGNK